MGFGDFLKKSSKKAVKISQTVGPEQIRLLEILDAHVTTLEAKETEMAGYSTEKTNLQDEIVTIETSTLPALRSDLTVLENTLDKNIKDHQTKVDNAWEKAYGSSSSSTNKILSTANSNWASSKKTAKTNEDNSRDLYNTWQGRYDNGCKANYGSFEGSYCGNRPAWGTKCYNKTHNYESPPPTKCLRSDQRKARNEYAKQRAGTTLASYRSYQTAKTNAYKKPIAVTNAEKNKASAVTSYNTTKALKEPMASTTIAINKKTFEIAEYVKTNGVIDKKNQRIAFIDAKISSITTEIADISREKFLAEQSYQDFLKDATKEQAIIDNAIAEEEAQRETTSKVLDASIEVNKKEVELLGNPDYKYLSNKKDANNKTFIIAGAAIILAGIYLIKKK